MVVKRPAWEFSRVWYASMATVFTAALPLGLLGWVPAWDYYMSYLVVFGLGWFGGPEWAAQVVDRTPTRDSGTKTSWIFWKLNTTSGFNWGRVGRVAYGIFIGVVLRWRLPDIWYIEDAIWFFFQTWLPYHYWAPGIRGPWEWIGANTIGRLLR